MLGSNTSGYFGDGDDDSVNIAVWYWGGGGYSILEIKKKPGRPELNKQGSPRPGDGDLVIGEDVFNKGKSVHAYQLL